MFISGAHIAVVGIGRRNNLKCVPVFNGSENRETERECCAEIFAGDTQKIFEIYFTDIDTNELIFKANTLENYKDFTLIGKNINKNS